MTADPSPQARDDASSPSPMPGLPAWRPPRHVWINCRDCGRLGRPVLAVTTVDQSTGERVWICPDCALPGPARARVVRGRLGLPPQSEAERMSYAEWARRQVAE